MDDAAKGATARRLLDEGWLVSTVFDARQGVGVHYSAHGAVVHFWRLDAMRSLTLAVDELPVLADYAESIGHASAGYLAWQAQALAQGVA